MCAIFGSKDKETFIKLYNLNKQRGISAHHVRVLDYKNREVGSWTMEGQMNDARLPDGKYYIGHCQAPTTENQKYDKDTTHPFRYQSYEVCHNGIITNVKQLVKSYKLENFKKYKVDSSIIPELCYEIGPRAACELLEGTFSLLIYNTKTYELFLARSGSTLFYNDQGDFSSTEFDGSKEFPEGKLASVSVDGIETEYTHFETHSPFFI